MKPMSVSDHHLMALAVVAVVAAVPACAAEQAEAAAPPSAEEALSSAPDIVFAADGSVKLPKSIARGQIVKVRVMRGRPSPCGGGLGEDFLVASYAYGHQSSAFGIAPGPVGSNVELFKEGTMRVPDDADSLGFYLSRQEATPPFRFYCYDSNHGNNYVVPVTHHH